jgi:anti-anti-sigma factor
LWHLHTKTQVEHGSPVLVVEGRLGHHSAGELEKTLLEHSTNGESTLVVDLSGVDYMSSAALKVFRSIADTRSIRLRAPSLAARFALELSGLLELVADDARE